VKLAREVIVIMQMLLLLLVVLFFIVTLDILSMLVILLFIDGTSLWEWLVSRQPELLRALNQLFR